MNILIITPKFPYPLDDGHKIRLFNLIKHTSKNHRISLISLCDSPVGAIHESPLQKYCEVIELVKVNKYSMKRFVKLAPALFSNTPISAKFLFFPKMAEKIKNLLQVRARSPRSYSLVQIEHSYMGLYLDVIKEFNVRKILTVHNLEFLRFPRMFKASRPGGRKLAFFIDSTRMCYWEPELAKKFDHIITVSERDKETLSAIEPELNISVIPNGVSLEYFSPSVIPPEPNSLLWVGSLLYEANKDAVIYFINSILPLINKEIPDVKLHIVGKITPKFENKLKKYKNVIVEGYVSDVRPYIERCEVFIVPLRAGGGTRLKILEAMAMEKPVVSTSIGCEGIDVVHGKNILIADTTKDFVKETVQLLQNKEVNEKIKKSARKSVEQKYNWKKIAKQLGTIYS
ncbi:glycosyltransferase [candidate division WOR-3 bacterium]|nr:glycosyltransferase [candidate division WOR-3 bacterium]